MSSEGTTHKISVPCCCFYFFSVLNLQPSLPQKRRRETIVTLGETRKSWEDVDKRTQNKRLKIALDLCEALKVPPSAFAEPCPSPSPLGPQETFAKLPRRTQRNAARTVGAHIASERQIHHMRVHDATSAGIRVLVALRNAEKEIILTEDEPRGNEVDFATVVEDPIQLIQYHVANLDKLSSKMVDHSLVRSLVFLGDFGQNFLSFGVRFLGDRSDSKDTFLPLYLHHGEDNFAKFKEFGRSVISALNSFDFAAAGLTCHLGGDMKWLNAVQGIMSPASFFFVPSAYGGDVIPAHEFRNAVRPSRTAVFSMDLTSRRPFARRW